MKSYGIKDVRTGKKFLHCNGVMIMWDDKEFYKFVSRHEAMEQLRSLHMNGDSRYIIMAEDEMEVV